MKFLGILACAVLAITLPSSEATPRLSNAAPVPRAVQAPSSILRQTNKREILQRLAAGPRLYRRAGPSAVPFIGVPPMFLAYSDSSPTVSVHGRFLTERDNRMTTPNGPDVPAKFSIDANHHLLSQYAGDNVAAVFSDGYISFESLENIAADQADSGTAFPAALLCTTVNTNGETQLSCGTSTVPTSTTFCAVNENGNYATLFAGPAFTQNCVPAVVKLEN